MCWMVEHLFSAYDGHVEPRAQDIPKRTTSMQSLCLVVVVVNASKVWVSNYRESDATARMTKTIIVAGLNSRTSSLITTGVVECN